MVLIRLYKNLATKHPLATWSLQSGIALGVGDVLSQLLMESHCSLAEVDIKRVSRFAIMGIAYTGPGALSWNWFLDWLWPMNNARVALKKMLLDQIVFAPIFTGNFMVVMALAQHQPWDKVWMKLKTDFVEVMASNWMIWPAVQAFNFYAMPMQHRSIPINMTLVFLFPYLVWLCSRPCIHCPIRIPDTGMMQYQERLVVSCSQKVTLCPGAVKTCGAFEADKRCNVCVRVDDEEGVEKIRAALKQKKICNQGMVTNFFPWDDKLRDCEKCPQPKDESRFDTNFCKDRKKICVRRKPLVDDDGNPLPFPYDECKDKQGYDKCGKMSPYIEKMKLRKCEPYELEEKRKYDVKLCDRCKQKSKKVPLTHCLHLADQRDSTPNEKDSKITKMKKANEKDAKVKKASEKDAKMNKASEKDKKMKKANEKDEKVKIDKDRKKSGAAKTTSLTDNRESLSAVAISDRGDTTEAQAQFPDSPKFATAEKEYDEDPKSQVDEDDLGASSSESNEDILEDDKEANSRAKGIEKRIVEQVPASVLVGSSLVAGGLSRLSDETESHIDGSEDSENMYDAHVTTEDEETEIIQAIESTSDDLGEKMVLDTDSLDSFTELATRDENKSEYQADITEDMESKYDAKTVVAIGDEINVHHEQDTYYDDSQSDDNLQATVAEHSAFTSVDTESVTMMNTAEETDIEIQSNLEVIEVPEADHFKFDEQEAERLPSAMKGLGLMSSDASPRQFLSSVTEMKFRKNKGEQIESVSETEGDVETNEDQFSHVQYDGEDVEKEFHFVTLERDQVSTYTTTQEEQNESDHQEEDQQIEAPEIGDVYRDSAPTPEDINKKIFSLHWLTSNTMEDGSVQTNSYTYHTADDGSVIVQTDGEEQVQEQYDGGEQDSGNKNKIIADNEDDGNHDRFDIADQESSNQNMFTSEDQDTDNLDKIQLDSIRTDDVDEFDSISSESLEQTKGIQIPLPLILMEKSGGKGLCSSALAKTDAAEFDKSKHVSELEHDEDQTEKTEDEQKESLLHLATENKLSSSEFVQFIEETLSQFGEKLNMEKREDKPCEISTTKQEDGDSDNIKFLDDDNENGICVEIEDVPSDAPAIVDCQHSENQPSTMVESSKHSENENDKSSNQDELMLDKVVIPLMMMNTCNLMDGEDIGKISSSFSNNSVSGVVDSDTGTRDEPGSNQTQENEGADPDDTNPDTTESSEEGVSNEEEVSNEDETAPTQSQSYAPSDRGVFSSMATSNLVESATFLRGNLLSPSTMKNKTVPPTSTKSYTEEGKERSADENIHEGSKSLNELSQTSKNSLEAEQSSIFKKKISSVTAENLVSNSDNKILSNVLPHLTTGEDEQSAKDANVTEDKVVVQQETSVQQEQLPGFQKEQQASEQQASDQQEQQPSVQQEQSSFQQEQQASVQEQSSVQQEQQASVQEQPSVQQEQQASVHQEQSSGEKEQRPKVQQSQEANVGGQPADNASNTESEDSAPQDAGSSRADGAAATSDRNQAEESGYVEKGKAAMDECLAKGCNAKDCLIHNLATHLVTCKLHGDQEGPEGETQSEGPKKECRVCKSKKKKQAKELKLIGSWLSIIWGEENEGDKKKEPSDDSDD